MVSADFAPRPVESHDGASVPGSNPFDAAMQAAATSDPLDPRNLSQIEKPKTEKDKDVPLDDNPGRRTNPNFHIPPEFQRTPWTYLENHFHGIPSGVLEQISK